VEVADIIRSAGDSFLDRSRRWITWQHRKVLLAILRCRTAVLGGHRDRCVDCDHVAISYNSCGNRHCPRCQGAACLRWLAAREAELLPTRYVHAVFTLPRELAPLALQNKKVIFNLLFHPHVHCILAAGGLSPDRTKWISSSRRFFLPIKVLSRVFRGKFVAGLKTAFNSGDLCFHGNLQHLAEPRAFRAWLRTLFRPDWVVYAKRPFGGPEHALRYLGAYTHRVAISNHRLVALSEGQITFRWRDSAHGNKKKPMTLPLDEFLRRFLLHLLPRGFVRIRNFGFLANRRRASLLPLCRELLLASTENTAATATRSASRSVLWRCPRCGGAMHMVERISAAQLLLRAPPLTIGCVT
jgi:hypothetical protein